MLRVWSLLVLLALPGAAASEIAGTVNVIDADTWEVAQTRIRLFGIDAPEVDQACTRPDGTLWACGEWATGQVVARYQSQPVRCTPLDRDRYGRTVARCTIGGQDVARQMVRDGWAFAYRRYAMDYDLDEKAAAVAGRGLHAAESQSPAAFRQARPPPPQAAPRAECAIKGNISAKGTQIYHLPGQADYDRTRIRTEKGERWFCSEADAQAAGWRRAAR
jgi:endonuclease YncB( thermonuclease family)